MCEELSGWVRSDLMYFAITILKYFSSTEGFNNVICKMFKNIK